LKNLVNVIVFPTVGKRPEQNKMSGGDLDGDVYFAIWDKTIVSNFGEEYEP
jgi:RNA-dependent RNA polymerase